MEVAGEQQRQARQYDRRAYLQRKAVAMEELAPKPTGREAIVAKRRAKAARIHGASRDAEAGPTMSESDLMGSGSIDEFKARQARKQQWRSRKDQERDERMSSVAAKEAAKMEAFRKQMGITAGSKFTIKPR